MSRLFLIAALTAGIFPASAQAPRLPNVLIIGDSISIGYTPEVRELLRGKANVFRPMAPNGKAAANCRSTTIGLKELQNWLGTTKWDVIHFNWGLHDLCYRNPSAKNQGNRDKEHGKIEVPLPEYERNLETLVAELEKTGARLIWASTTKVPEGEAGRFVGDEVKYNEAARRVMAKHGIPIDDLYALSLKVPQTEWLAAGNVHFKPEGYRRLAEQVTHTIERYLPPASGR